ncbi:MAG TPA: energy transducer TonB, partial [Thermoanaerobaculia bacterium]|nr:energy transducer TonB [Thermoanaerobaculia bacterium]
MVFRLALCVLAALWAVPAFGAQVDSKAQAKSLERAFKLIGDGKFKQARTEIDKATVAAGGPCGECLLGLSHIYASEQKWSEAADASRQAIPLLKSPALQARAYNQLGIANVMLNTPESLAQAEEELRKAADAGGAWGAMARYNLAELLYRRRSWAEAAEAARLYLQEAGPGGTTLKEARVLLCRARNLLPEEPSPEVEGASKDAMPDPLRVGGGVSRPEILYQEDPQYTEAARQARVEGTVILEAIIDEDGCVRNARALRGLSHGMTESALGTVRRWVFRPAMLE